MARPTVRKLSRQVIDSLKQRAAANDSSAEAEHRRDPAKGPVSDEGAFADRARAMRQRLASSIDSTDTIRADRERGLLS